MTAAQILFAVGLAVVTVLVMGFAAYTFSSTRWASRWYPGRRSKP